MVVVVVVPRCLSRGVVLLLHYSGDLKESFFLSSEEEEEFLFFFFGDVRFRVFSVFFSFSFPTLHFFVFHSS